MFLSELIVNPNGVIFTLPTIITAPTEAETEELSRSAALLYGLIHARYIITSHGLESMVGFNQEAIVQCALKDNR
jgi:Casein kinase II regulatory subunit